MPPAPIVRSPTPSDFDEWLVLWQGYNAFYGRAGETALPARVTEETWRRFFDPGEPVRALVAELDGEIVGLTHYLFHRSTTSVEGRVLPAGPVHGRGCARTRRGARADRGRVRARANGRIEARVL